MRSATRAVLLAWLVAAPALGGCTTAGLGGVETTATVAAPPPATRAPDEPKDDLVLAKEHFRARNYGLAEMHFRRAVERAKGDAEAWLGLAASYDQLKRFRLADRAYAQALKLMGPTPEFLNNRGYSHLLRGDLAKASRDLSEAQAQDPDNEQIRNNLKALEARARGRG
ncbi:MAG TPA: tetratricopeptide repeat protein [Beijerinckiaceae bacterium]|jgi:Flp pilus assembly protein TadD